MRLLQHYQICKELEILVKNFDPLIPSFHTALYFPMQPKFHLAWSTMHSPLIPFIFKNIFQKKEFLIKYYFFRLIHNLVANFDALLKSLFFDVLWFEFFSLNSKKTGTLQNLRPAALMRVFFTTVVHGMIILKITQ